MKGGVYRMLTMNSYFRGKDRKLIRYSGQTGSIDSLCRPQKEGGRVFRLPDYCRLFMTMADAFRTRMENCVILHPKS